MRRFCCLLVAVLVCVPQVVTAQMQPWLTTGIALPGTCTPGAMFALSGTSEPGMYICNVGPSGSEWVSMRAATSVFGPSAPSTCSVGATYTNTVTGKFYNCPTTNTWTEISGGGGEGGEVTQGTTPWVVSGTVAVTGSLTNAELRAQAIEVTSESEPIANNATLIQVRDSLLTIDPGIPAGLGQTTMAASMPVVLASNQSAVNVSIAPLGQAFMTASLPVTIASNQSPVEVTGSVGVAQSGNWSVAQSGSWTTTLLAGNNNIGDVDIATLPSVTIGTFPDNEPFNISQMNGVTVAMGVGASSTGTQRVAGLIHDGTDTAQVTTTAGGSLQVECAAGCGSAATANIASISTSESVAAPTAAVWYVKRQWALPASAHFTPTRAYAAVTTAGSRTLVGVINNLGNLNLSTNTYTAANSVASPFFYGRLFGCVTTVMSATADTITPTYTDELGNSQAATGVAFASASPVGNCYEFPLAAAAGATIDAGVRAVTAASDNAAPTGVVTFYGVNPLLDTVGPANTLDSTVLDTGELNANEQMIIMLLQAATTAQQRSAGVTGAIR